MPFWRRRKRPIDRKKVPKSLSAKERTKILESLDRMAEKHGIDRHEFLNCIEKAWKQETSSCNHIDITCRERTGYSSIFLFTSRSEVVAQFPVPTAILRSIHWFLVLGKTETISSLAGCSTLLGILLNFQIDRSSLVTSSLPELGTLRWSISLNSI